MKHKKNSPKSHMNQKSKHSSSETHDELSPKTTETKTQTEIEAETPIDANEVDAVSMDNVSSENMDETQSPYKIEIPGYEMMREKAPKVAEVADAIYDQWKKDGDFQGLPLPIPPLAQVAVGLGLRKAKDLEKKLDEKGVFTAAKMGVEFAKMKVEQSQNPLIKKFLKK